MQLTKQDLATYDSFIERLEETFSRYMEEIDHPLKKKSYSFDIRDVHRWDYEYDSDSALFCWEETWRGGGSEEHIVYMPWTYIFDYETWRRKHDEIFAAAQKKAEAREAARAAAQKERELQLLAELQEKYLEKPSEKNPWGHPTPESKHRFRDGPPPRAYLFPT